MSASPSLGLTTSPAVDTSAGTLSFIPSDQPKRPFSRPVVNTGYLLYCHLNYRRRVKEGAASVVAPVNFDLSWWFSGVHAVVDDAVGAGPHVRVVGVARDAVGADLLVAGPGADDDDLVVGHEQLERRGIVQ